MITESVTNCVKDYCPCFQYKAYSEVCKNIALRLVLLCVLFAIMGNALSAEALLPDATPIYKSVGGHDLKLHIFNPPDFRPGDRRAAILFFFGGGWVTGLAQQFYPQCSRIAALGVVAISAEYRVQQKHGTSPRESIADGKSVIRWLRTHAVEFGIDPDRITAGSASAGGHIALMTAMNRNIEDLTDDLKVSCIPNALVLFNPVLNSGRDGYGYDRVSGYWKDVSPIHNVSISIPPTIIFQGSLDSIVPEATAEKFKKKLDELGNRCGLIIYVGKNHGFFNYSRGNEYFDKTLKEIEKFLRSLKFLDSLSNTLTENQSTRGVLQTKAPENETYSCYRGGGYIGSHMLKCLLYAGHAVTMRDDLSSGFKASLLGGELVSGDFVDRHSK